MGDTDDRTSDPARWARLLHWLKSSHGMDTRALAVEARSVAGAGRGLFAAKSCPPSTILFIIPKNALTNLNTLKSLYPQAAETRLSAVQIISLHLLLHRPVGEEDSLDATFGPYISTLPRSFDSHPLTWLVQRSRKGRKTTEELILKNLPPSVTDTLHTLYARFLEDYQTICLYLNRNRAVLDNASRAKSHLPMPYGTCTSTTLVSDYCWAWLNVNTRSIYYPIKDADPEKDCLTLCPILDFANHNEASSQILPILEPSLRSPGSHKHSGDFEFRSCSDSTIEDGQQLFLRYGGHSNRTLFVEYGFVNRFPSDSIANGHFRGEVDVQDLVEELILAVNPAPNGLGRSRTRSNIGDWVTNTLQEEGYWGEWTLDSAPEPAHPSYRLITALRLVQLVSALGTGSLLDDETQPWRDVLSGRRESISEENEKSWRDALLKVCERTSRRARTGIDRTVQELAGADGWAAWMRENVLYLWREEAQVADAVAQSLRAGEVF